MSADAKGALRAYLAARKDCELLTAEQAAAEKKKEQAARVLAAAIGDGAATCDGYLVTVHEGGGKPSIVNVRKVRQL